jgi:hypothetical protein
MYDDDGGAGPAPSGGMGMPKFNLEGLIPLILLIVVGIVALSYFGIIDVPYITQDSHTQVLFIGEPSVGEKVVLDNLKYSLTYRVRDAASFGNTASEELSQYDIVILDQSMTNKSVTVALGEAIEKYVNKGGKLILVQNSGIYQNVGLYGAVATDVVGWKATFGNIMPVECSLGSDSIPSCSEGSERTVVGRVIMEDYSHPIMAGIEMSPPAGQAPYTMRLFDIQANEGAKRIAYIKEEGLPRTFPAILEKGFLGKVIYFNYDPGLTPGILTNTIRYLD